MSLLLSFFEVVNLQIVKALSGLLEVHNLSLSVDPTDGTVSDRNFTKAKTDLLKKQKCVTLCWIYFYRCVIVRGHGFESREIIVDVPEVGMLLHDWVIVKNVALNPRHLVDEVLWVLLQKSISLIFGLAPVAVGRRILAVD